MNDQKFVILDICQIDNKFSYLSNIEDARSQAELDIQILNETIASVDALKPQCDKLDYTLSVCSGALCGIIDIFLVGKPGESPLGNVTDDWFGQMTTKFAKKCGWKPRGEEKLKNAIAWLEENFQVPYDQRGCGDPATFIDVHTNDHHFYVPMPLHVEIQQEVL